MVDRIGLDVPYTEKDQAQRAGARWDPAQRWYARSATTWALDPSILTDAGIAPTPPRGAEGRGVPAPTLAAERGARRPR